MNSKERVLAAINHTTPDRLPITFDAEPEVIAMLQKHFGVADKDGVWDSLNVDTRLVGADHTYHHIKEENEHGVRYDFWGIGEIKQEYSGGFYWEYHDFPLSDAETIDDGYRRAGATDTGIQSARGSSHKVRALRQPDHLA